MNYCSSDKKGYEEAMKKIGAEDLKHYKLSIPCSICTKDIFLSQDTTTIKGIPVHLICYDNNAYKEEIRFLTKVRKMLYKEEFIRALGLVHNRIKELEEKIE